MEQKNKVVRSNDQMEVDDGERDENEISYMDKLPPEILKKILEYLDEQQLVKCRLLGSRWNEICCLLLQNKTKDKPDSKLVVKIITIRGKKGLHCRTVNTKPFEDFLDCFAPSEAEKVASSGRRPFPFSQFKVTGLHNLGRNQMTRFVPLLRHIKSLIIEVTNKETKNFDTFWRLLLKFAPNIEHLRLDGARWPEMQFFEPYFNFKANSDPFEEIDDKSQIQDVSFLNKLKIMEVELEDCHVYFSHQNVVVESLNNVLENTPNLQELICYESPKLLYKIEPDPNNMGGAIEIPVPWKPMFGQFHILSVWQELHRAHLLKKLKIKNVLDGSEGLGTPAPLMKNLQLEHLVADCKVSSDSTENESSIPNYIYHALKSSQNTLSSLNLQNLTVKSMNLFFKDISCLPNVRQLKIENTDPRSENGRILEKFSQLCPNVKILNSDFYQGEFSQVARILWTEFKGLQSLKMIVNMPDERNNLLLVDSAISGYSKESIERIQSKLEEGIPLDEARGGEQQNPSILDLKDLSRLELEFFMGKRTSETEKVENLLRNSVFVKILPQYIRENPRSILHLYFG